jgi:hypothetical protein
MWAVSEREMSARIGAPGVEPVGLGEQGGIAVGGADRDANQLAGGDLGLAQPDRRGRVSVDHSGRGFQAQRLVDHGV